MASSEKCNITASPTLLLPTFPALAAQGAEVALTFQSSGDLASPVVASIEKLGRRSVAIQADMADPAAIKESVEEAVRALRGLDILVNNAGIVRYNTIADFKLEDIDALFAVNVRGPILATRSAPWGLTASLAHQLRSIT